MISMTLSNLFVHTKIKNAIFYTFFYWYVFSLLTYIYKQFLRNDSFIKTAHRRVILGDACKTTFFIYKHKGALVLVTPLTSTGS